MANNNPTPAGYSVQFGYGVQPESKATEYIDSKGVRLNHTFTEINNLFAGSGDNLIGTQRTGSIASGSTVGQSLDSITQAILNDRGNANDLEYWFQNNTKSVAGMETNEDALWIAGGGAILTHDTSLWKIGRQTLELTEADNVAGTNYATMSLTSPIDLTKFNSLFASSVDTDFIRLAFYVSNPAKVNISPGAGISILLSSDPTAATNRKRIDIKTLPAGAGWVYVDAPKSAFTDDTGVGDWSNIQSIRIAWAATANAINEFVAFDDIWMCRQDPITYVPNPFQRKINGVWTRDYTIVDGYWYVGDEVVAGFLQALDINPGVSGYGTVPAALKGQEEYTDFEAEMMVFIETGSGGYSNSLVWEINDNQRVAVFLNNNQLYLNTHFDTVDASFTTPFLNFVGNLVVITLSKVGSTVIAKVKQSNDFDISTVRTEINTTQAGVISIGNLATWTPMLTLAVTTTNYAQVAGKSYIIGNTPWFSVVSRDNASYDYYIDPVSGNDLFNGLSTAQAFRTIQRFLLEPFAYTYIRNGIMNVHLAAGTYGETITMPPVLGSGTMNWIGVTAASVFIDHISCHSTYMYTTFQNISLTATGTAIYLDGVNKMYFNNIWATATTTATTNYGAQIFFSNAFFDVCTFSHKKAVFKGHFPGTHVLQNDCSGTGNTYSMYMEYGAIGHIMGSTPVATASTFYTNDALIIPFPVSASVGTANYAISAGTAAAAATVTSGATLSLGTSVCTGNFTVSGTLFATVGTAAYAVSAGTAARATTADGASYALSAAIADQANFATTAGFASTASTLLSGANLSLGTSVVTGNLTVSGTLFATVGTASYAVSAGTAAKAANITSGTSISIATSVCTGNFTVSGTLFAVVGTASYATQAGTAQFAVSAGTAAYAVSAGYATAAGTAVYAVTAGTAAYAVSAGYATAAGTAVYAGTAGTAAYAVSAGYATAAGTAVYAVTAGTAAYAVSAGYATAAGTAVYAGTAGTAAYAVSAGYATAAGTAVYATSAGTATYATQAGALSGLTTPVSAINNAISGLVASVNATNLNSLMSGLGASANNATNLNTLLVGLGNTVSAIKLNAFISGTTASVVGSAFNNVFSGLNAGVNATSLNNMVSGAGAGVNASTLTNLVSGNTVAASAVNNALSGLVASVNGTNLNSLVSGLVASVNATNLNSLMSGLGNTVSAAKLNDTVSGLISTAGLLNDVFYRAGASTSVKIANMLIQGSAADNTVFTAVTAFGLSTVLGTWANVNGVAAAICPNVSFTATSVTLRLFFATGAAATAGNAIYCTIYAFGYV